MEGTGEREATREGRRAGVRGRKGVEEVGSGEKTRGVEINQGARGMKRMMNDKGHCLTRFGKGQKN